MAMFYGANKVNATDGEHMLSYRLFQIAKRLNSGELLLLKTLYDSRRSGDYESQTMRLADWASKVAKTQSHGISSLVIKEEQTLVKEHLISGYEDATVTPINQVVRVERLTDLGKAFYRNIEVYRVETQPDSE
jgi:hypothetical protein